MWKNSLTQQQPMMKQGISRNGRLRGALIGYGFIGSQGHIPAYLERQKTTRDVEIVAVADICDARRNVAAKDLPGVRIYDSHKALLAAEGNRLDFVDICTPPCDHTAIARAAFERGLHVLCEKPLAITREDAAALVKQAMRSRRVLYPCNNYKYAPVVVAIRDIIRSGRIGKVRSISLATFRNTHAKGVLEWNTDWRRQLRHGGGGIAMDHGSHSFYLAFDWMDAYPTSVTARMFNLEPNRYDTEDNFFAVLGFPNGIAHAQLTWTAGVRKVIYTIQGDRGAITVDDDDLQLAVMQPAEVPEVAQGAVCWDVERHSIASRWMDASHTHWFNAMFDNFVSAVIREDFAGKDAQDAYRCIDLITTAYQSAKAGGRELPLNIAPVEREGRYNEVFAASGVGVVAPNVIWRQTS
jgi:predicted dehydrogenase